MKLILPITIAVFTLLAKGDVKAQGNPTPPCRARTLDLRAFQCQDGIHGTNGADYGAIVNGIILIDTKAITNTALTPPPGPGIHQVNPDDAVQEVILHELLHAIHNGLGPDNELDELVFEKYLFPIAQTRIFVPKFDTVEVASADSDNRNSELSKSFGAVDPIDINNPNAAYYGKFFIFDRNSKKILIRAANGRGTVVNF